MRGASPSSASTSTSYALASAEGESQGEGDDYEYVASKQCLRTPRKRHRTRNSIQGGTHGAPKRRTGEKTQPVVPTVSSIAGSIASKGRAANQDVPASILPSCEEGTCNASSWLLKRAKDDRLCEKRPMEHGAESMDEDRSNPFEMLSLYAEDLGASLALRVEKMRDAIDLYRFLSLPDTRFLGSKHPPYRAFLIRNLSYMRRRAIAFPSMAEVMAHEGESPHNTPEPPHVASLATAAIRTDSGSNKLPEMESMSATIKFNFIRNNLCFGDKSAIVQCFHVTEEDSYYFGPLKRIPSSTFDMRVNEKLYHVSIDLPEAFSTEFLSAVCPTSSGTRSYKSRTEYFVVRVVFRYEDTEVGGGKRLRKVPSRQGQGSKKPSNGSSTTNMKRFPAAREASKEVVMFGAKPISQYTFGDGVDITSGETSIVLFSCDELKIPEDEWTKKLGCLIPRLSKLQRKAVDNPFMSIQILTDDDDDGTSNSASEAEPLGRESLTSEQREKNTVGPMPPRIALKFIVGLRESKSSRMRAENLTFQGDLEEAESTNLATRLFAIAGAGISQLVKANSGRHTTLPNFFTRIVDPSHTCFFCLTRVQCPDLNAYLTHLRHSHPRLNFTYEPKMCIRGSCGGFVLLPGFVVSLNEQFDGSHEWDADWHYSVTTKAAYPQHRIVVHPTWIITREASRYMRAFIPMEIGETPTLPLAYSNAIKDFSTSRHSGVHGNARFICRSQARIDHVWLRQTNLRDLSEITDLHDSERQMMGLWNDFLLEAHISHLGNSLVYKTLRAFVESKSKTMRDLRLHSNFLLHLTNLMAAGVLDEEERYDLIMRLNADGYDPAKDSMHFAARQFTLLEKELEAGANNNSNSEISAEPCKNSSRIPPKRSLSIDSMADLRCRYPFASTRRLDKILKFVKPFHAHKYGLNLS